MSLVIAETSSTLIITDTSPGVNGDFNFKDNGFINRFGYDTGFVYERYSSLRTDTGDADGRLLGQEVFDGNFNPFIGQLAPLVGTAPTYTNGVQTGTAPYDNRAAAQRSAYLGHSLFNERDWLGDAKVNANLFPNLWNGGIGISIGFEHREIAQNSIPGPGPSFGQSTRIQPGASDKVSARSQFLFC